MVRDVQILRGEPDECVCYCHADQDIDYFHHQEVPSLALSSPYTSHALLPQIISV